MTDSIVPYETMNEQLMELKGIKTVSRANGDYYWFVGDRIVYLVKCAINTFNIELRIPYSLFDGLTVEERGSVAYINLGSDALYGFRECGSLMNSVVSGKHWSCSREPRWSLSLIR